MFTWLNKQGVQSDRGFIFQFTGRFSAEYREGEKVVSLDVEDGISGGRQCIIIDPNAFRRWDSGTLITPAQQEYLFKNVKEAIEFQGLDMILEKGE